MNDLTINSLNNFQPCVVLLLFFVVCGVASHRWSAELDKIWFASQQLWCRIEADPNVHRTREHAFLEICEALSSWLFIWFFVQKFPSLCSHLSWLAMIAVSAISFFHLGATSKLLDDEKQTTSIVFSHHTHKSYTKKDPGDAIEQTCSSHRRDFEWTWYCRHRRIQCRILAWYQSSSGKWEDVIWREWGYKQLEKVFYSVDYHGMLVNINGTAWNRIIYRILFVQQLSIVLNIGCGSLSLQKKRLLLKMKRFQIFKAIQ